jgi:hypothetical protein
MEGEVKRHDAQYSDD